MATRVLHETSIPSLASPRNAISPSANPSFHNETEFRYFKIFQDRTAIELSGFFDSSIWIRSVLQICHTEEFAREAVIAIGALHAITEIVQDYSTTHSKSERETAQPHHAFALEHYGKALHCMRKLSQAGTSPWLRNTLLSCLLTICFESYVGSQRNALAQAQAGVEILLQTAMETQCRSLEDLALLMASHSLHDTDLLGTYARLDISLISLRSCGEAPRRTVPLRIDEIAALKNIPSAFNSVNEARFSWDILIRRALQWREAWTDRLECSNLDLGECNATYTVLKAGPDAGRLQIETELHVQAAKTKWLVAFQPLFKRSRNRPGTKEFLGASVLMIQYLSSSISTRTMGQTLEGCYDAFLEDFTAIVDLARGCLETSSSTGSPRRAVFVFDNGLVAGIFMVATRCRDCTVRRNAIELLAKYPRREGLWDTSMAAKVGIWIMSSEEKGMADGYVVEEARLKIVKTESKLTERKVVLRYSKLVNDTGERVEMPEVVLCW